MSNWHIPLSDIDYDQKEREAILRVLTSKWLSMGPEVKAFENEFAKAIGVKHSIAVSNGTAALHLSYLALNLGSGDEIIQPAINFVAAANMTVGVGCIPIFADILSVNEPTIDPTEIEDRITSRTKAVVVMHYGGYLCRMAEIKKICKRHNLPLIEDACHALGSKYLDPNKQSPHNKMAGSIGDISCFSFFSNKNLVTGEGGMVVTNRDDLAEKIRLLRSHGMTTLTWDRHKGHASSYDVILNGFNYRFDELRAALGRCQLAKLKQNNNQRKNLVLTYRKHLSSLSSWTIPFKDYQGDSAYHLMVILAPTRNHQLQTIEDLSKNKIQTSAHYPFLPKLSVFKKFKSHGLDRSLTFSNHIITLPLFPTLSSKDVEKICEVILHGSK